MSEPCDFPTCTNQARNRYPGNDPENGPARAYCPAGHSTCYGCRAWFQAKHDTYEADCCDACDRWKSECEYGQPFEARPIPVGIKYRIESETIGDEHDPYMRTFYSVWNSEFTLSMMCCGLAGNRLTINDVDVPRGPDLSDSEWDSLCELWFEAVCGVRPDDVAHADEVRQAGYADIRDAELAAGWDPSP